MALQEAKGSSPSANGDLILPCKLTWHPKTLLDESLFAPPFWVPCEHVGMYLKYCRKNLAVLQQWQPDMLEGPRLPT